MKGGKTPIHLWGRWCPSDFLEDETVKLVAARGDTVSLAVYFMALQASHRAGGDLPADREELAALLGMPRRVVERGLAIWLERGKLIEDGGRLFHRRVQVEVATELEFRESQADCGRKGGLARASRLAQVKPKASLPGASSEPQARRTPYALRLTPAPTNGECAEAVTRFNRAFGLAFNRRATLPPDKARIFAARMQAGYPLEFLVGLPIAVRALGLDKGRDVAPEFLLRDGSRSYTRNGETRQTFDWIGTLWQSADRLSLTPAHAEALAEVGALEWWRGRGVTVQATEAPEC